MFTQAIFYLFGGLLILSGLMVITVRNPVFAALFLVLSFFSSAAIWLILGAEFLAIALVLVYVGAVMVLFLFVVMMLDINLTRIREGFARYLPVGILVAILMMVAMGLVVGTDYFARVNESSIISAVPAVSNTSLLGKTLYTDYLFQFEIAGVILLVAIIAAIALTHRKPRSSKSQKPGMQVQARREDRVKLVKMQSDQQQ